MIKQIELEQYIKVINTKYYIVNPISIKGRKYNGDVDIIAYWAFNNINFNNVGNITDNPLQIIIHGDLHEPLYTVPQKPHHLSVHFEFDDGESYKKTNVFHLYIENDQVYADTLPYITSFGKSKFGKSKFK